MDRLPAELLAEIGHHLPLEDLPSYRLVSRAIAAIIAPQLFHELVFHASNASFNRIHAVAAHPVFRDYVKSLIWDSNVYDRGIDTFEEWTRGYGDEIYVPVDNFPDEEDDLSHEKYVDEDLEKNIDEMFERRQQFTIYQQKVREEVDVMNHLLKGATAAHVFGLLKNVTQLFTCNGSFKRSRDAIWTDGPGREPKNPKYENDYTVTRGIHENYHYTKKPGGSEALINGVNSMGHHLVSLSVFNLAYTTFDPTEFPSNLASGLPKLKSLQLNILCEGREECRNIMRHGCLKSFIGGLKLLEELDISFDNGFEWVEITDSPYTPFDDVIPSNISSLLSVDFRCMQITETGFMAFLLNNAQTLRSIRLGEVCFDNEEIWKHVFNTIRSQLQLRSICIGGALLVKQLQLGVSSCDWLEVHVLESPWLEYRIIQA